MDLHLVTTTFIAHPETVGAAYNDYRSRIAQSGVEIVAVSARAHSAGPSAGDYLLWSLRTEAAYAGLPAPAKMEPYHVRALIRVDESALDDEEYHDKLVEYFFLEPMAERAQFPSFVHGFLSLTERRPATGTLTGIDVYYLGDEDNKQRAAELYAALIEATDPVAHLGLDELDVIGNAEAVGPLWLRDAANNLAGTGDGIYSMGKTAWSAWLLTDGAPREVISAVEESMTEPIVLARAVSDPL